MKRKLMGKKCGMVRLFDKDGSPVACTLIKIDPNVVTQIKTVATDGYDAVQLAAESIRVKDERTVEKRISKQLQGHYKKAHVGPHKCLFEIRIDDPASYAIGQEFNVSIFDGVSYVDIVGRSRGLGYQGVMKKYGFSGGPASHGSGFHRHAGSTGMRSTPGRCLPGGPRPSHMGDETKTVQNMKVFAVDVEKGLLIVEGSVPGAKNGRVFVCDAKKK